MASQVERIKWIEVFLMKNSVTCLLFSLSTAPFYLITCYPLVSPP
jgi:hypothetical protein